MMNEYMEDTAGRGTVQLPLPTQQLTAEVAGDFTLPDYQPEIKRLLRIGVNLLPPTRSGGGGDLTGSMDYYVLYVGQDGGVYCVPLSTEYRLEPKPGTADRMLPVSEPVICLCDLFPDVPVGRVVAPRRLSIRCKIKAKVGTYGEAPLAPAGIRDSEEDPTLETLTATVPAARLTWGMGEPLPLQDDIILSPSDGEMRVICAEGQVMVTEAIPAAGLVNCRGEVLVKLTLCPAEDPPAFAPAFSEATAPSAREESPALTVLRRKIPFSQAVQTEGVTPACSAAALGYCPDISVQMEDGHLHVDVGVLLETRAQRNETVTYTADLYSTRRDSTCRLVEHPAESALRAFNGNFTLSDSLPLSETGIDPAARVADVTATAIPESLTHDPAKDRCLLTGTCHCHLLLLRDGEYSPAEITLPFRYEFDTPHSTPSEASHDTPAPPPAFDGGVTVVNCRARMDGERIGVDAELAVALRTYIPSPFTALTDVTLGEEVTRRRGEYVICFPAPTDTAWSVAKRYHAPMAALTAANNLPAGSNVDARESLEGIGYLIV